MKRSTDAPSSGLMRYFTPQLYLQFNSDDDRQADAAQIAWDAALDRYREHLAGLRDDVPPHIMRLAKLALHDAEVLAFDQRPPDPKPRSAAVHQQPRMQILSVLRDDQERVVTILYSLADRVRTAKARGWPFSSARRHWLYDELDVAPDDRSTLLHRILFSDGLTVEIPFSTAIVHEFSLFGQGAAERA
jgi:hypothetical protein